MDTTISVRFYLLGIFGLFFFLPLSLCDQAAQARKCPVWRDLPPTLDRFGFPEAQPPQLPPGTNWSSCLIAKDESFTHESASTTVHLYQTEESWQQEPRRDDVLSAIRSAIKKGLELFGTHAGTPSAPLEIHATLSDVTTADRRPSIQDARGWNQLPGGIGSPCYLSFAYPRNSTAPLVHLQKEVVNSLYRCVQWYHHPKMRDSSEKFFDFTTAWWWLSTARFFDELAWPAPKELLAPGMKHYEDEGYLQNYRLNVPLDNNRAASSILWHYAYGHAGWSLQNITDWTKRWPSEAESWVSRNYFYKDKRFRTLFQDFGHALVQGEITYPGSTTPIELSRDDFFKNGWILQTGELSPGQEGDSFPLKVVSWEVFTGRFGLVAGQVVDIVPVIPTSVWKPMQLDEKAASVRPWEDKPELSDLVWSYRAAGTNDTFIKVDRSTPVRISTPEGRGVYEFVMTWTGNHYGVYLPFKVKRVQ